tara:strand:+ start:3136 stop:3483 length:348 start_codon:yes stop_codon:yes gene_type:complete
MLKGVEGRVKNILEKYPQARDDDMKLMAFMIYDFYNWNKHYINSKSAKDVCTDIYQGKVAHFTSVLRCRQKLQEKCPELRGKLYELRKRRADIVKEQIKEFEPEYVETQTNLFKE